jgi:phage terminase large subunit
VNLEIETARVFVPLLAPARYKGAHGGRGSGKSHFFAEKLIEDCLAAPGESAGMGMRSVCIREVQKTLKESSKRLLEDKLRAFGLGEAAGFKVFQEVIATPGDGLIAFQGMQDHTAESIKSLEGFRRAWIEEAQNLSGRSLALLRPTIRTEDSELWFSWNARRKSDAVDAMLRGASPPTGAVVVHANWRDNPKFPKVLEQERLDCLKNQPEQYDHIWEGGYATVLEGAYYARDIATAKADGRVGKVAVDPLMTLRVFCDLGGTGAKADAFTMWVGQFVGREIRALDYYEAVGQPLGAHLTWLRSKGYTPEKASIWLPHDGETNDRIHDVSFESAFRQVGYAVEVVKNQGKGAAKLRIEAGRRMFPSIWFNQATTQPGIDAIGWYHEKKDPARDIGLGPEHDWSSHGADAFGLMCIVAESNPATKPLNLEKLMNYSTAFG